MGLRYLAGLALIAMMMTGCSDCDQAESSKKGPTAAKACPEAEVHQPTPAPEGQCDGDDYAIYSVLMKESSRFTYEGKFFVIQDGYGAMPDYSFDPKVRETIEGDKIFLLEKFPGVETQMADNFYRLPREARKFRPCFGPAAPYLLLSQEQSKVVFNDKCGKDWTCWDDFAHCFPEADGMVELGHITYSSDHGQALASIYFIRHYLSSRGFNVLLHQVGGVWTIKDFYLTHGT